jgi:ABC-type transport system involved in multi-copper enzyme maturation permease subunit
MMASSLSWRQIAFMTLADIRRSLSGGAGLFFIFVVLLIGWILLTVVTDPLAGLVIEESGQTASPAAITQQIAQYFGPLIAWWVDAPSQVDPAVVHLITEHPAVMSLFLIIFAAFIPFTSCLVGSDQLAADLSTRHTRVLLLRTGRTELMLSRFFGVVVFSALISLILVLFVAAFISLKFPGFDPLGLIGWGFKGWVALVIISLPYLALTTWLSLYVRTTAMVFVLSWLITTGAIVGFKVMATQFSAPWIEGLSPWAWKYGLFHPDPSRFFTSLAIFLGFTLLLLVLARFRFHRRDV